MLLVFDIVWCRYILVPLLVLLVWSNILIVSGLHLTVTPTMLIQQVTYTGRRVVFTTFTPSFTNVWNIHRLLSYPRYNFSEHYFMYTEISKSQQADLFQFFHLEELHNTIFRFSLVACANKWLNAIFPVDETLEVKPYKGVILQEAHRFLPITSFGRFQGCMWRALSHTIINNVLRAESWSLVTDYMDKYSDSEDLLESLTVNQRLIPEILQYGLENNDFMVNYLERVYFYNDAKYKDEMHWRVLIFNIVVRKSRKKVKDIRDDLLERNQNPGAYKLLKKAESYDGLALLESARTSSEALKTMAWSTVAYYLAQMDVLLPQSDPASQFTLIDQVLEGHADIWKHVAPASIVPVVGKYHALCSNHQIEMVRERCMGILARIPDKYKPAMLKSFSERLKVWYQTGPLNPSEMEHTIRRSIKSYEVLLGEIQPPTLDMNLADFFRQKLAELYQISAFPHKYLAQGSYQLFMNTRIYLYTSIWALLMAFSMTMDMGFLFPSQDENPDPSWDDVKLHWQEMGRTLSGPAFVLKREYAQEYILFRPNELRSLIDESYKGVKPVVQ